MRISSAYIRTPRGAAWPRSAARGRFLAPIRSHSACPRRVDRLSSTWGPRRSWGPIWPIARGWVSCSPKGSPSTPKGDRPGTRPKPGSAHFSRSAAIRALASPLSSRPWVCSPARRSTPTRTTATCLIDRIKATPRQPGVREIRIPGERAFRSREQKLRDGIEIDRVVYDALKSLHLDLRPAASSQN